MKLEDTDITGHGKRRLLFGVNIDEAELMLKILIKARKDFPKTLQMEIERDRLLGMVEELSKSLARINRR